MSESDVRRDQELGRRDREKEPHGGPIPGAAGHPEPGSGHDDSKHVTTREGPPTEKVEGVPGATGEGQGESQAGEA
ncbi:MAG TPA: hypothetical protein VIL01_16825 [Thermomicrobiales bacterium]|mgnify:CR=1 FL=1|jgi:hypothetical protein